MLRCMRRRLSRFSKFVNNYALRMDHRGTYVQRLKAPAGGQVAAWARTLWRGHGFYRGSRYWSKETSALCNILDLLIYIGHIPILYTCNADSRGWGRKPVSWIKFNANHPGKSSVLVRWSVDKDHHIPP